MCVVQERKKRGEEWTGPDYLAMVVPPVLNSLVDADARVRYYACEALYNIAKVPAPAALACIPCKLFQQMHVPNESLYM